MPSISNICHIFGRGSSRRSPRTPRVLSPNASLSILYFYEAVLPSLKQNLMQICCSFTSVILAGRYDRKTALTRSHKNAQEQHTRPHSRTPLGRMVQKGQSSRYLAAQNCTTSDCRAAFKFCGFLGSASLSLLLSCYMFRHCRRLQGAYTKISWIHTALKQVKKHTYIHTYVVLYLCMASHPRRGWCQPSTMLQIVSFPHHSAYNIHHHNIF